MSDVRPQPGTPMIMQWRKWDGSPHWRHECLHLGADQWGDWVGQPVGWPSARPGASLLTESPNVTLVPRDVTDYALTVNRDHPRGLRIYIDIGWDVRWTDAPIAGDMPVLATGIDMDLDVVRRTDERGLYIDDRDEWAEHIIRYGYPADVIAQLERRALELEQQVGARDAPFDDATADAWLDRLIDLRLER